MNPADERTFRETLTSASAAAGLPLNAEQVDTCTRFAAMLLDMNTRMNLTRITEPAAMAVKHFVDSLTLLKAVPDLDEGALLVDVGTGAGFPGIALKIARPDLQVTLMDATAKRLTFLKDAAEALDLRGISLAHIRAEDAGRDERYRDMFDVVAARAVAALPILLEWCGPLTVEGGHLVAMKAANVDEEMATVKGAAGKLGLKLAEDIALTLPPAPGEEEPAHRRLLVYVKTKPTPPRYPRRSAEIKSRPLD